MSQVIKSEVAFTQEQITSAITKITRAGKALSRGVEEVLVMAVYDSLVNESPEVANALIGALRMSTKKAGIVAFLEKFGQLYDKGGKTGFVHFNLGTQAKLAWTKDYVELVQDEASGWESYKPTPEVKAFDAVAALEAVVKAHAAAEKKGSPVVHGDLVPRISALIAQYTAAKALEKAAAPAESKELATA